MAKSAWERWDGLDLVSVAPFHEDKGWAVFASEVGQGLPADRTATDWNDLAVALFHMGNEPRAIEALRCALELDPELVAARLNLSVVTHRSGDRAAARDMVDDLIRQRPEPPHARAIRAAMECDRLWHEPFSPSPDSHYVAIYARQAASVLLATALARLLAVREGRTSWKAAYVGRQPLIGTVAEALGDVGFEHCGADFATGLEGRPIESLPSDVEVVFVGDMDHQVEIRLIRALRQHLGPFAHIIPLQRWSLAHLHSLSAAVDMPTLLNPMKLALIAVGLAMAPDRGDVIEVGVFRGGTTVYMALFQRFLGFHRRIYALDTFGGIPVAGEADRDANGHAPWDAGEFTETSLEQVERTFARGGVENDITALPGLVQDILPRVLEQVTSLAFVFSDTDQYAGTLASLRAALPCLDPLGSVIIDDFCCRGVAAATTEVLAEFPAYAGGSVSPNLFLLHRAYKKN